MGRGKILVVDDTKLICKMIHDKLAATGYDVEEAHDGLAAVKKAKSYAPDGIILDVMLPGMDGYAVAHTLRGDPQTAHTPILMLTAKAGVQEKIAGFEAGADDYLTKPFDPTELELRLRALLTRGRDGHAPGTALAGQLIAVFSLRGGTGVSSLAANLAVTLAQLLETDIPLVDLALENGSASLLLDLLPRYTIVDLAREENPLEEDIVKQHFVRHASGVCLLAAPATPALAESVTPRMVHELIPILKRAYPLSLVDLPHNLGELSLAVLDAAESVLLVVPPDMASVKSATAAIDTFSSLGYPRHQVQVIVNWVFPRRGLGQKEIELTLSAIPAAVLPYESEALVRAINEGVPAVLAQPAAPWSQAVEALAFRLLPVDSKNQAERAGLRRFAQVKKRLAGA